MHAFDTGWSIYMLDLLSSADADRFYRLLHLSRDAAKTTLVLRFERRSNIDPQLDVSASIDTSCDGSWTEDDPYLFRASTQAGTKGVLISTNVEPAASAAVTLTPPAGVSLRPGSAFAGDPGQEIGSHNFG